MNVKSFVNGLDPENTVKGYYDENDQLVMVEPEGSGGDFTTANVTVKSTNLADGDAVDYYLPIVIEDEDEDPTCTAGRLLIIGNTVKVPLYKGTATGSRGSTDMTVSVESGEAEADVFGSLIINGDCSIIINTQG